MKKYIVGFLLILSCYVVAAQEYFVKQYRVEKGLPSDIIKGVAQDSLGYFWIATDEGLVKYDGLHFTSYREAMRSNYAKGFLTTRNGRLLAFGDLDLIEIKNSGDTVVFERMCPVVRVANDSSLSYPKLLFEDVHGDIWVSESQSVVRLSGQSLKRYSFDLANRSPIFLRSFAFFEDSRKDLFIVSHQGNVFRYNRSTDTFESVAEKLPPAIEFASTTGDKLIVGAADGVWEATLAKGGGIAKPQLKKKIPFVCYIKFLPGGKYLIATRGHQHFISDAEFTQITPLLDDINNVNHIYESREGDLWLSSNEGLVMMREDLFEVVDENVADFVEAITQDPVSGKIYYAIYSTLYAFDPVTKINTMLLDLPNGYFQSLVATPEGIWVANSFRVFLLKDGQIKKQFDFSRHARFVTGLFQDSKRNIWLIIPGLKEAYMIDTAMNLHQFSVPLENESLINVIREGKGGIYAGSNGHDSFLFVKSFSDSAFRKINTTLTFSPRTDFNVPDLAIIDDDIWLASSEGLLKSDHTKTQRIDLGSHFTGLPVRTIYVQPDHKVLTANAFGMILYDPDTGTFDLFNESSGLQSNTITRFLLDSKSNLWVGTAKGLCYSSRPLSKLSQTPQPRFTETLVNGKKISLRTSKHEIEYGSFLSVLVSSITFPENEITFQYRLLPDSAWKTTTDFELRFPRLQPGHHTLEVKSKKNGPYSWSNPSHLSFVVDKPFWQQAWFYGVCLVGIFGLIGITSAGVNARNQKRNRELQTLVNERTRELQVRNEELVKLNQEKNNLIGIVAHDLKSPLNQVASLITLIKLTKNVDEETTGYLTQAEGSAQRLNGMILKILDTDAIESRQLNLNMETLNFSEVVSAVAARFDEEASRKNISITRLVESSLFVIADRGYVEQVLENLLSNAIKFSPLGSHIFVNLRAQAGKITCEIKDNGPGISQADHRKLFGKYQKLSARPTANEASTGLGLSIVKKFVLAMKGEIWCESEEGKGASFFVTFGKVS